jgi:hypothetical protein
MDIIGKKCVDSRHIAEFVQFFALMVSLHFLFRHNERALEGTEPEESIRFIAREINRLWRGSKQISFQENGPIKRIFTKLL